MRRSSLSRASTSSPPSIDCNGNSHSDQPPRKPEYSSLSLIERNDMRRRYEKDMFRYVVQHGTVSIEPCGPCLRTKTECIRHPILRKCALCFRGHDVCEIWDESVLSNRRRRINRIPTFSRKERKVYLSNRMY